MSDFHAAIANFIGSGVGIEKYDGGAWSRTLFNISIPDHEITIKQKREFATASANDYRGLFVHTSDITITKVKTLEQGERLAHDLASLLSIVSQSHVSAYAFEFEGQGKQISTSGFVGKWRTPFGPESERIADFVEQVWQNYSQLREPRALNALIRIIIQCDAPDTPMELKIAQAMICLENIKTYWALTEGKKHGIVERSNGSFSYAKSRKKTLTFRELLEATLNDVGMPLPASFDTLQKVRNAILHRGLLRPQDSLTHKIYGSNLSDLEIIRKMRETYECAQDTLHEYLFRLLGFKGQFHNYSKPYGRGDWTIIS